LKSRAQVDAETFKRWERLSLQRALDGMQVRRSYAWPENRFTG
jgi:hypothetical protein